MTEWCATPLTNGARLLYSVVLGCCRQCATRNVGLVTSVVGCGTVARDESSGVRFQTWAHGPNDADCSCNI